MSAPMVRSVWAKNGIAQGFKLSQEESIAFWIIMPNAVNHKDCGLFSTLVYAVWAVQYDSYLR